MKQDNFDNWIKYLSPDNLKGNLLGCSLYVAIYESLTDYITEQVRFFYHIGFDENGDKFDPKYKVEVLSLDKNQLNASLKWFLNNGAISDDDYSKFHDLRRYRNKITHKMMDMIFEGVSSDYEENFSDLINLRMKIEKWWVMEIEIPTNPEPEKYSQVKEEDIMTGSQMLFRLIADLLSEDEKTANFYREEFLKYKSNKK